MLDEQLRAAGVDRAGAVVIAGLLRERLPDVGNAVIGRVLAALAGESSVIAALVAGPPTPGRPGGVARLWAALAGAGLGFLCRVLL